MPGRAGFNDAMKLNIERAILLKSLGHVQSVVERRNTIQILSNVKLSAASGLLTLTATDMDLEVSEEVTCEVTAEGTTTVPAHTLYDIVRKLPDGALIRIDATGGGERMVLSCGRSQFTLACLPTGDFPLIPVDDVAFSFRLAARDLRGLIDRTRFAISTEETRYYLNGVYVHAVTEDGVDVLRAVATDGHRLASVQVPLPPGCSGMPGVIVPRKTVTEVRKLLEDGDEDIGISLSSTKIRFSIGRAVLVSKLIDGTFPDYQRVIPTHNEKHLDVNCKSFAAAVDRVAAISSDRSRAVKLSVADGTLILHSSSPEHGNASEELDCRYDGDAMEIGFNSRYLLDIAEQIEGDSARFFLADPASPTIMAELGDASAIYVLMPMRV